MLTSYTKITDIPTLQAIINVLKHYKPDRKFVEAFELDLPFYHFTQLVVVKNTNKKNELQYDVSFLRHLSEYQPLNFTNKPIYDWNSKHGIILSEENVVEYAYFFFSQVRGRHGFFRILLKPEDIPFLANTEGVDDEPEEKSKEDLIENDAELCRHLKSLIKPPSFIGINEKGNT
jgi:hypothetical protein